MWVKSMLETQATFPNLFNSDAVLKSDFLDERAAGPGTSVNIPYLKDITDQNDEIQVEDTAPTVDNGAPGDVQNFPLLNRVTKNSVTALSVQVSGADPVGRIISSMVMRRLKQRQKTFVAMLRGLFGTAGAANVAAPLSAVRLGGTVNEPFTESGNGATDAQLIDSDKFIDTCTLLGELSEDIANGGCILCHPNVRARLQKIDSQSFALVILKSQVPYKLTTYRDIPLFVSNALVRAGTNNGFVYDTYILSKDAVGYGEKPQASDVKDVASLSYFYDRDKNNDLIYDRTRFLMGVDGTKWVGNPAGQSATNAELQTIANWQLLYQSADRCGIAVIRTNG